MTLGFGTYIVLDHFQVELSNSLSSIRDRILCLCGETVILMHAIACYKIPKVELQNTEPPTVETVYT